MTAKELGSGDRLARSLRELAKTVDERATSGDPAKSYTAKLLQKGTPKSAKKLGEEAVELVMALVSEDDQAVRSETADLLYHLVVALRSRGISLDEVGEALESRQGMSGLDEKAARKKG